MSVPGNTGPKPVTGADLKCVGDIQYASKEVLSVQVANQAERLNVASNHLRLVTSLAGEWMEPDDLTTVRDKILSAVVPLNQQVDEVLHRFGSLIQDVYTVINKKQHKRGFVLHPVRPIHDAGAGAALAGGDQIPQPAADVVFVHGLDGGAFDTWQHPRLWPLDSWPLWLAKKLPHVNVWALGYPAAQTADGDRQGFPLEWSAREALAVLTDKGVGTRPLVFVAHSLGGLLVKQMTVLSWSHRDKKIEDRFLAKNLRGVVFLATPHDGSYLASLAVAARWLRQCTATVEYLCKNDPTIEQLGTTFRVDYAKDAKPPLKVHAHREQVQLTARGRFKRLGAYVVEPSSADPKMGERFDEVKDHITICKCESRVERVYLKTLEMILAVAPRPAPQAGAAGPSKPSLL